MMKKKFENKIINCIIKFKKIKEKNLKVVMIQKIRFF